MARLAGPQFGEIHIVDENGETLPAYKEGLIYFSGGIDFEYYVAAASQRQNAEARA